MSLLQTTITGRALRTSHSQVVSVLGQEIVSGIFAEHAILPGDAELSARFGVSRTVLREAMKTLSAKRLIEPKAKVGTRVLERSEWNLFDADVLGWRFLGGVDETFIDDLAEIRLALEPAAAAMAARRASSEDIAHLREIADRFYDPLHTRESIARVDLEFHVAVLQLSANPFMRSIGALIEAALSVTFRLSSPAASPQHITECAVNHMRIVNAIAARDEAGARSAMENVIHLGAERTRVALHNIETAQA
ncbi:FadR family transcriptional regulator [Aureimonas fodinaquatilis]|uniref:FadR family transcriptional regulator n=1 Tax=Aureimonas fodinaquatilis TaxID=2565783 RepID=A0A5B0E171_9HYPH|nr:FadR/GntR family transcriptional regulator [Aureimonas fodinaquatilis]KAA0972052.1 FadR family transcriptional regulator [Aureimonas fodinaquatilis]